MTQISANTHAQTMSTTDLVERLIEFDGPPDQFLIEMLTVQCRVAGASGGALLRGGANGRPEVVASVPSVEQSATPPVWLSMALETLASGEPGHQPIVRPVHRAEDLYGQTAGEHVVVVPLRRRGQLRGGAAYRLLTQDASRVEKACERLEWSVSMLNVYELRLTLQQRRADLQRLRRSQEVLASINQQEKFGAAAMALCNEIAARWGADRVSLGFVEGRYVKLVAMSHTEKFTRKMKLVQDLEAAMEESLDQDLEVIYPAEEQAPYVWRAAERFSRQHGPTTVATLPLRYQGEPVAVLLAERDIDQPWRLEEMEALRLLAELSSSRLVELRHRDRWFGARWARQSRKALSTIVGPKHTWAKVAALLVIGLALFLTFARGTYRVEAPFTIEASEQRVMPAPFAGELESVHVEPGDRVEAGAVLAELRTIELEKELLRAQSERAERQTEAAIAERDGDPAKKAIALKQAERLAAEIEIIRHRLTRSSITAPIAGVVVKGDLKERVGGPVEQGEPLFEIAPLSEMRAVLSVPEEAVVDLLPRLERMAQEAGGPLLAPSKSLSGELAAAASPGQRLDFEVQSVDPIAEVAGEKNVFKMKVRLDPADPQFADARRWLRPGMEGLAKIELDERSYAWMWTKDLVNWVRMKLWI